MSYVENPDAIGNPDEEPRVHLGSDLVAALKALGVVCDCGGMNGYHEDGCERAGSGPSREGRDDDAG